MSFERSCTEFMKCGLVIDFLANALMLIGLGCMISTGVIFVNPVIQESKYQEGVCALTNIKTGIDTCQLDGYSKGYFLSVKLEGQFLDNSNPGNFIDTKIGRTWKTLAKDDQYVSFGAGATYSCAERSIMASIQRKIMAEDFPEFDESWTDLNSVFHYDRADIYIIKKCYFHAGTSSAIMHKNVSFYPVYVLYFVLSVVIFITGIGLTFTRLYTRKRRRDLVENNENGSQTLVPTCDSTTPAFNLQQPPVPSYDELVNQPPPALSEPPPPSYDEAHAMTMIR